MQIRRCDFTPHSGQVYFDPRVRGEVSGSPDEVGAPLENEVDNPPEDEVDDISPDDCCSELIYRRLILERCNSL